MTDLSKTYLFRMTHIENIPHILQYGITHQSSLNANPNFVSIGDSTIISTRNDFLLTNGRKLGDYIPFYFGVRTPMLYVIQKGLKKTPETFEEIFGDMRYPTPAENIVYCITTVKEIIEQHLDFIFTNGHAINSFTSQYSPDDIINLGNIIDRKALMKKYWQDENDLDLKRRKEAEFLVLGDIPIEGILGFVVYNQNAQTRMIGLGADATKVLIKSDYYF
jgi:hypothetical protein